MHWYFALILDGRCVEWTLWRMQAEGLLDDFENAWCASVRSCATQNWPAGLVEGKKRCKGE